MSGDSDLVGGGGGGGGGGGAGGGGGGEGHRLAVMNSVSLPCIASAPIDPICAASVGILELGEANSAKDAMTTTVANNTPQPMRDSAKPHLHVCSCCSLCHRASSISSEN